MAQVLRILIHMYVFWQMIVNLVEATTQDDFCICFESRRSNWELGVGARVCFGQDFLDKGKNETCNPEVDLEVCKEQRLHNLALKYVTDLEKVDRYFGLGTEPPTDRTIKTNLRKMIQKYNDFFKYHPVVEEACGAWDWPKREILRDLSSFNDFRREYSRDRETMPEAVAITKAFLLGENLKKEVDRVCDEQPTSHYCVEMRQMSRIIGKMDDLLKNAYAFRPAEKEELIEAYRLSFVPFILKYPEWKEIQPSSKAKRTQLYELFTDKLVSYTAKKDLERLERLMRFLPDYEDMRDCNTYQTGDYCTFRSATDQLSQYLMKRKARQATKKKTDGLKFGLKSYIDYKSYMKNFWRQAVLEKMRSSRKTFRIVQDFLRDEIGETGQRMYELKDYFNQLEGFNKRIATADMAYLEGMIHHAFVGFSKGRQEVKELMTDVEEWVYDINIHSLWWNLLGLGASLLTTALDPRKWIQGNAISDLVETTNELLATGANLREANEISTALIKMHKYMRKLYYDLDANDDFLRVVKKILPTSELNVTSEEFNHAKKEFLQKYTDYSPKVRQADITRAGELFNNVIDRLCSFVEEGQGVVANIKAAQFYYDGKCYKLMSAVARMTSFNQQLYEFQFEYMDAMAEHMRASTATFASREIKADLFHRITDPSTTRLRSMTVGAFFTHEMQKWQIMEDYCDILEYRNGGLRPGICTGLSTDFPTLLAYIPKECDSDVEQIVDIPAQENTSGKKPDASAIYLNALLSGSPVTLQVPNTDWLIKNKWITKEDVNSAIFVKNFELFMPAQHRPTRKIRTEVTAAINRLYPGGPIYGIRPAAVFVTEYEVGKADLGCRIPLMSNPYSTCSHRQMPKICERTKENNDDNFETMTKYPSVFASWNIKIFGYENYKVDNYTTPFKIKAKVQLCKIRDRIPATYYEKPTEEGDSDGDEPDEDAEHKDRVSSTEEWGCCYDNTYFNATANECRNCPNGSRRGMAGYACFSR